MKRVLRIFGIAVLTVVLLGAFVVLDPGHSASRLIWGKFTPLARALFAAEGRQDTAAVRALVATDTDFGWRANDPRWRAVLTAAGRSAQPIGGGFLEGVRYVDYIVPGVRWCQRADEPNILQVQSVRAGGAWKVKTATAWPC